MSKNDKKNKRGARGSVEEETNEAKRPFLSASSPDNMAGTKSNVDDNNEVEPTLTVLRNMLADLHVQQAVKNISKESRVMKDEITDIKTSLRQQGEKFNKMEECVTVVFVAKRQRSASRGFACQMKKVSTCGYIPLRSDLVVRAKNNRYECV